MALTDPVLLAQWDRERNGDLTPNDVTYGSRRKVWWRCEKGHSWQAQIKSRTLLGAGCPLLQSGGPGERSRHPAARSGRPMGPVGTCPPRSGGRGATGFGGCAGGHLAGRGGARANGERCPVCAGKVVIPGENDLATLYQEVAEQWDGEKNGTLTAKEVSPYSNRKAWWRCREGHSWQAAIAARTKRKTGCPYCTGRKVLAGFNDLATLS